MITGAIHQISFGVEPTDDFNLPNALALAHAADAAYTLCTIFGSQTNTQIAVIEDERVIILAARGSKMEQFNNGGIRDFIMDADFNMISTSHGRVHHGFALCEQEIFNDSLSVLTDLQRRTRKP